jgi:hypothetical protein
MTAVMPATFADDQILPSARHSAKIFLPMAKFCRVPGTWQRKFFADN